MDSRQIENMLRHAYESLPNLPADKLKLLGEDVDAASATLTEALHGQLSDNTSHADTHARQDIEPKLTTAQPAKQPTTSKSPSRKKACAVKKNKDVRRSTRTQRPRRKNEDK